MTESREITNYDKAWAEQASQYASQEKLVSGAFLSARGGTLMLGDEVLPGNQACVIILDAIFENTYYAGKFDPDVKAPPVCYAFGRGPEGQAEMAPHESMQADLSYFEPQSTDCASCKWNEWGSADTGRGKACQNRRRLSVIPAGYYKPKRGSRDMDLEIFDDPQHFKTAEVVSVKLSVGSVKPWSQYVNQIATIPRPPHGVITRLSVESDPKYQFLYQFEMIEELPDTLIQTIMVRHEEAMKSIIQGYRPPEERAPAHTENPRGSLRNLRR